MINEIRDTIQGTCTIGSDGYGVVTKRINLKKGYRHQIDHIDIFNDMGVRRIVTGKPSLPIVQVP